MLHGCYDLIAAAAACLRAGPDAAPVRVALSRHGGDLLVAYRPHGAVLTLAAPGPVVALGPQTGQPGPVGLHLDPSAVRRAIADLPAAGPPVAFPARFVRDGGHRGHLAALRVQSALAAHGLAAAPDLPPGWPETADPVLLDLLRLLLGAARECSTTPSAGWLARLVAALDAQWRAGQGPWMRLIDPADPGATDARLALAGRAAAVLARAAAAGLV